ncbi:MAG: hypothetical protein A2Y10_00180 [Planctomycetes bacterium GWF2_41_51]|nr:MAG: hypothetical protein A2Y10_00180 [Planctomycetes bacterium GWF2_41_51]HBG27097.1 hypothetical protein [Phycisphaerales bacterium]
MIYFDCQNCGKWFSAPDNCAGKKGKCSKCNSVVTIPSSNKEFLPPELQKPKFTNDVPEPFVNTLNEEFKDEKDEKDLKRKFPWFIDVFFYPLNATGISMILIMAGIPFLIMCLSLFMMPWPVIGLFISLTGSLIILVINLYAYFYICQCVRNSAEGYVRLSVNVSEYSSLGETFFMMLRTIGCFLFFLILPFIRLYQYNEPDGILDFLLFFPEYSKPDKIFYYVLAASAAVFPMGLLSIIMHSSILGLNPILLIKSVLKTFLYYVPLVLALWASIFAIQYFRFFFTKAAVGNIVLFTIGIGFARFIKIYLLMVAAHLLGRFYYKNAERLNWEI